MRIVAGRHRGRRLAAPPGWAVRPTGARTREALFDILAHGRLTADGASPLVDARILDAFAGSGALGLEALSRGAAEAIFMERDAAALRAVRANIRTLGETARAMVLACDPGDPPRAPQPCTLAFLDPPYGQGLAAPALVALDRAGWLADGAIVSVELAADEPFVPPPRIEILDERRYGKARIVLLRRRGQGERG